MFAALAREKNMKLLLVLVLLGFAGVATAGTSHWCNPYSQEFNARNGFFVQSAGNWSQQLAFNVVENIETPSVFTYVIGTQYYQRNYYDQERCRFLSSEVWTICPNAEPSISWFPPGLYFRTVAHDIIIDRANPTSFQRYKVKSLTPPLPFDLLLPDASWTSTSIPPASLVSVATDPSSGVITSTETISVLPDDTRAYVSTIFTGEFWTSSLFVFNDDTISEAIDAIPSPYDVYLNQFINGDISLVYLRSCDGGESWDVGSYPSYCYGCSEEVVPMCKSAYYLDYIDPYLCGY